MNLVTILKNLSKCVVEGKSLLGQAYGPNQRSPTDIAMTAAFTFFAVGCVMYFVSTQKSRLASAIQTSISDPARIGLDEGRVQQKRRRAEELRTEAVIGAKVGKACCLTALAVVSLSVTILGWIGAAKTNCMSNLDLRVNNG